MATREKTNRATPAGATGNLSEMSDRRRIITLALGDVLVFVIFATFGMNSHSELNLAAVPQIAVVAAPFALGWFLVAPFFGAFRRDAVNQPRTMMLRTVGAWIIACPLGLALRWLLVGHAPPAAFVLVAFTFNLVILLVWRWPFAINNSLRSREQAPKS